jgi:hypothetical protein
MHLSCTWANCTSNRGKVKKKSKFSFEYLQDKSLPLAEVQGLSKILSAAWLAKAAVNFFFERL